MTPLLIAAVAASVAAAPPVTWRASPASPNVVFAPTDGPDAAIRVTFLAGAADDGLEEGLTRLSQYAILHGQDKAPYADLDGALYGADASIEVNTNVRECSFEMVAPSSSFDALAARLLSLVLAPSVSKSGLERARHLATTDILEIGSDAWMQAFIASSVMITEGVDGGGDYNNPIFGDIDTLRRIPLASVQKHLATKLAPANAMIVVTGRFDQARLKSVIAKFHGGKSRALRRPDIVKYLPFDRDKPAPHEVHMQLQVVDVTDAKSAAVVHLLSAYLHDRLFWKLRKSGHVYSPFVSAEFEEWMDYIVVELSVTPGSTVDFRDLMLSELDALATGTVDEESFARAKAIAGARLEALEESPGAYAQALTARARGEITVGPEVREALASVDKAALLDAAARFLSRKRAVSFVFGHTRTDAAPRHAEDAP